MNERVSIKEGGLTRELSPIDKVKVNNTDETQSIWVSKDDMHTGTLYATENGIYIASEDGYDAYDEVLIRVTDESYDGGNEWKDVDPDVDRYTWDDTTYQDYKIDPDSFDDKFNDPTKWKDEDLGDNLDYKYNDGNSISGIDPETGNKMEVSLDEDGFLDEEVLPSSIAITREPFRLKYMNGEMISFAGLVVQAYTEDGNVWTDANHPSGIIPQSELSFPVTVAVGEEDGLEEYEATIDADYDWLSSYSLPLSIIRGTIRSDKTFEETGVRSVWELRSDAYGVQIYNDVIAFCSESPFELTWHTESYWPGYPDEIHDINVGNLKQDVTPGGKTVYYATQAFRDPIGENVTDNSPYHICIILFDGILKKKKKETQQTVPVIWNRVGDGKALETSFTITVISDGSGGSGGSGGDSGGISYGGNDYMLNPNSVVGLSYNPDSKKVIAPNIGEYNVNQAIDVGLLIPKEE